MIGIIILNYINWDSTEKCINSIFDTLENIDFRIYLIDNASPNKAPDKMLELINSKNITFISNEKNTGYSSGNNIGIKKALDNDCETILIANNDVIFAKNSIMEMYNYLIANNQVGIVGPKIYKIDGDVQLPSMLIKTSLKEKYLVTTFLRNFSSYSKEKYYCNINDVDKTLKVHAVLGCCFMMSYQCAMDITPFDENTFLFEEELIIGIQMENKKYETIYLPTSSVIHEHGQSTKNVRAFSFICLVESEIYYCKKYLNTKTIQILPLYFIRTMSYLFRCFTYEDFRNKIAEYFKRTLPLLNKIDVK